MTPATTLRAGNIVHSPTLPEPVEVLAVIPMGNAVKLIGHGLRTGLTHDPVLTPDQIAQLTVSSGAEPLDGDARLFRLGVKAQRLGLAYGYDPFFALSIARVEPLPHQLEAVYNYFLQLPRIRFLLADDPGAGKTIMAGLLLKELKARGLIKRILIVTPANPHPETGEVHKLFTKREVRTAAFDLDGDELDFYDELTRFVEDQSAAASEETARGRAIGFTMALLQRRMASSVYAVRRSLERMTERREKILEDPEAHRRQQIDQRIPEDFDDLTDEEQARIISRLEGEVLSADPTVLRAEITQLTRLIDQARTLEARDAQSKLNKLRTVLTG